MRPKRSPAAKPVVRGRWSVTARARNATAQAATAAKYPSADVPAHTAMRRQDEERGGAAREGLAGERSYGYEDRGRGGRSDGDDEGARPGSAAQPDPVEEDEGEGGARRVAGDVRGPVVGGAEQDVAGEVPQGVRDVVKAVDDLEVLVPGRRSRRAIPRCQPSTRAREKVQAVAVAHAAHTRGRQGSRAASVGPYATTATARASAAGVPGPVWGSQLAYRGGLADVQDVLGALDGDADQRGRHDEQRGGDDGVQVAAEIAVHARRR